ncbi:MAG: hypothetical protein J7M21_01420 [Planctomycetes bacterium]|nr:hypothetical protein [Planctomycetota bacterium]
MFRRLSAIAALAMVLLPIGGRPCMVGAGVAAVATPAGAVVGGGHFVFPAPAAGAILMLTALWLAVRVLERRRCRPAR